MRLRKELKTLIKLIFFYDGETIPFENNSFDSIVSTKVLEHLFTIYELLEEFYIVLKPNGKAVITTPFMWEEHEIPYYFARYTTPDLLHLYKYNASL